MKKVVYTLLLIVLVACGGNNNSEEKKEVTEASLKADIKQMEDSLFGANSTLNKESAEKMIAMYMDFAGLYPKTKEAPDYLMKAADVATAINKPSVKEECYKKIINEYPDYPRMDVVKYLLAFTLDAELNQRGEAKEWYNKVVAEVKDTNFVRDAKVRLKSIDSLDYEAFMQMIINQQPLQ